MSLACRTEEESGEILMVGAERTSETKQTEIGCENRRPIGHYWHVFREDIGMAIDRWRKQDDINTVKA